MKRLRWDKVLEAAVQAKVITQKDADNWDVRACKRLLQHMGLPERLGNFAQDCGTGGEWIISDTQLPYNGIEIKVKDGKMLRAVDRSGRIYKI